MLRSRLALAVLVLAMPAFAKRLPPADVPPVVDGNVRYEAPHFSNPCSQNGGCVVAHDATTGAQLWAVKVYCTSYDAFLERDVQDVFITSLTVVDGGVAVADEKGRHFETAFATQAVTGDARGCAGASCGAAPDGAFGWWALAAAGLAWLCAVRGRTPRAE